MASVGQSSSGSGVVTGRFRFRFERGAALLEIDSESPNKTCENGYRRRCISAEAAVMVAAAIARTAASVPLLSAARSRF